MKTLTILFFLASAITAEGQSYSIKMDSLTKKYLAQIPNSQQQKFTPILLHRDSIHLHQRMDTIVCDYTFVEESFCESNGKESTYERYFFESDSTLDHYYNSTHRYVTVPRYSYYNGLDYSWKEAYFSHSVVGAFFDQVYEYYYTLDTLLKNYSNLQPIQELTYDSTIASFNASDTSSIKKRQLEQQYNLELRTTYKIQTFIDHKRQEVRVSVQLPAVHPDVKIRYVQKVIQDW